MVVGGNHLIVEDYGCSDRNISKHIRSELDIGVSPVDVRSSFPDGGSCHTRISILVCVNPEDSCTELCAVLLFENQEIITLSEVGRNVEADFSAFVHKVLQFNKP